MLWVAMYSLVQDSEQGTWETKTNLAVMTLETGEYKADREFLTRSLKRMTARIRMMMQNF